MESLWKKWKNHENTLLNTILTQISAIFFYSLKNQYLLLYFHTDKGESYGECLKVSFKKVLIINKMAFMERTDLKKN